MHEATAEKAFSLRPATPADKPRIYDWLAHSNLTGEMLGPPRFPDAPVPTWNDFDADYADHYFTGSDPELGRCFIITLHGTDIGQINYNPIVDRTTEIDIWLADRRYAGHGYGTAAIRLLCNHLFAVLGCNQVIIAPSRRNVAAVKAYAKAGFRETNEIPALFEPDYDDAVVMVLKR